MSTHAHPAPERVAPVDGGVLRSDDLRDLLALADHQRRRHVRALHGTWGIAAGLMYTVGGPLGLGHIQGGIAYDRCGRLLVLPTTVALPAAGQLAGPRIVVLRADLAAGEPAARLALREPAEVDAGLDVVLGTVAARGAKVVWSDDGRRYVATAAPVRLAAGRIARGTLAATGTLEEWTAVVDVSAGFDEIPVYVAGVGSRPAPGSSAATRPAPDGPASVQVVERGRASFTIAVRRPSPDRRAPTDVSRTPEDIAWIAAAGQSDAWVPEFHPPNGPYPGFFSQGEHR
jgi:hypothetical protein